MSALRRTGRDPVPALQGQRKCGLFEVRRQRLGAALHAVYGDRTFAV